MALSYDEKRDFHFWRSCCCFCRLVYPLQSLQSVWRHKPNGSTFSKCEFLPLFSLKPHGQIIPPLISLDSYSRIRKRERERWDGGMRAVFAQWKRGLRQRPILGLKCLKTMTTSTSPTTDDMWCISCGRSKEALWKLSWPHFLLHWNHGEVTHQGRERKWAIKEQTGASF